MSKDDKDKGRWGAQRRGQEPELPPSPAEGLPAVDQGVLEETLGSAEEGELTGGFLPPAPELALRDLPELREPPKQAESPEPAKDPVYTVAPGVSLTSQRGILGAGTVVTPKDFLGGQATIDHLASVGNLTKS